MVSMAVDALPCLHYVLAAAEHGSMRKVARAFGIEASCVSRSIVALEQRLDIPLFDRSTKGVCLTKEGRLFIETIRGPYEDLEQALSDTARRDKEKDRLRIGLGFLPARKFLLPLIERFNRAYPHVTIAIEDVAWGKHGEAIRRRHLDAAFMFGEGEAWSCRSETIWSEHLAVLVPAAHALAGKEALSWHDLEGERLLVLLGPSRAEPGLRSFSQTVGAGGHGVIFEPETSQETVIVKVQLGMGCALFAESLADAVVREGTTLRPLKGRGSAGPVKVLWLETNPKRAALRLIALARQMGKEQGQ